MSVASFGYTNHFLTDALSSATNMAGFPVTNLAGQRQLPPYRTNTGFLSLRFDLDSAAHTSWDCVGLFGTNFTSAATYTITVSTTQGGTDIYGPVGASCNVFAGYKQTIILNPPAA